MVQPLGNYSIGRLAGWLSTHALIALSIGILLKALIFHFLVSFYVKIGSPNARLSYLVYL